jgi:signal transduction histidine kinase
MGKLTLGFRAKIFLLTLPIVFFVDLAVIGTYIFMDRREQLKQRKESGSIFSQNFNKQLLPLMKTKNYPVLSSFIYNLAGMKNVLYATVQDPQGNIITKSENSERFFMEKKKIKDIYSSEIYTLRKYFNPGSKTWVDEIHIPLFEGTIQHGSIQIGYAHALLTGAAVTMIKIGLLAGGAIILLSLPLSFLTASILTRPVRKFIKDIKIIDEGNLNHKVNIPARDEIGRLAKEFNSLTTNLKNTLEEKDDYARKLADMNVNLEKLVEQRTEQLKKTYVDLQQTHSELKQTHGELQRTQAQLVQSEKMASLGQLVAGIAHELNNPISFIYGNMDHLESYVQEMKTLITTFTNLNFLSPEEKKQVDEMVQNADLDFVLQDLDKLIKSCRNGAERTKNIVTSLRNFSRLDEAEYKKADIHEGLDSTLDILTSYYKNRITVHKDYGPLPKIPCFASQLNQVFMNLLANASQAIEGKGDLWIKTSIKDKKALISIKDSGKGVSEENIKKLFTPFFTTKPVGQGTGLGLSVSYGIIQKHNGRIEVESKVGVGTTFTIELPLEGVKNEKT